MADVIKNDIEDKIFTIRGAQVMLDRDLPELYCMETKVLNQAVKRNIERFPIEFRFQLSEIEKDELVTNCDQLQLLKHSSSLPFAFTEQGVLCSQQFLQMKQLLKQVFISSMVLKK